MNVVKLMWHRQIIVAVRVEFEITLVINIAENSLVII